MIRQERAQSDWAFSLTQCATINAITDACQTNAFTDGHPSALGA